MSLFFGDNVTCDTIADTHLTMMGTFSLTALVMMVLVGYVVKKILFQGHGGIYDALPTINTAPQSSATMNMLLLLLLLFVSTFVMFMFPTLLVSKIMGSESLLAMLEISAMGTSTTDLP